MSNSKRWLLTISGGADSDLQTMRAGVDLALAAGALGQAVALVFSGAALQLLSATPTHEEALYRLLGSLPYYDIERVFALGHPADNRTYRDDLTIAPLTPREWSDKVANADIAVNY